MGKVYVLMREATYGDDYLVCCRHVGCPAWDYLASGCLKKWKSLAVLTRYVKKQHCFKGHKLYGVCIDNETHSVIGDPVTL